MRINVSVNAPVSDETRAYAEYRFFTAIAPHFARVRGIEVTVREDARANRRFLCTATVELGHAGEVKAQARAAHPSAAIERAADRIAALIKRRLGDDFSMKVIAASP
jgi:ribosome-associated translation inhibitor RaiA